MKCVSGFLRMINNMSRQEKMRWSYYGLKKNDGFKEFWSERFSQKRNVLYILGIGFDPRMCLCIEELSKIRQSSIIECMVIEYGKKQSSHSSSNIDKQNNEKKLNTILGKDIKKIAHDISSTKKSNSVESRNITKIFSKISDFEKYDDIIVDISAFPVNLFFPLIGRILNILDSENDKSKIPDFHVIAAENIEIDKRIKETEIDDRADYLFGFASDLGKEAGKKPHVWIPILGENSDIQLDKIRALVNPTEICPLIPSPSKNPRRGDDILQKYVDLFSTFEIEIRNYIYGDEQNPFETYRQIMETSYHYPEILKSLGGCKIVLSALTSKLLSMSALLVAYECGMNKDLSVGVAHVAGKRYEIEPEAKKNSILDKSEIFSLWLKGSCYDE